MTRENLVKRLGKKFLPCLLTCALTFGALVKCGNDFVEPEPKKPVVMQPVAMLSADPTEGTVQLRVYFDASKSTCDPNYYIKEYHLDFDGDGSTDRISGSPWVYYTYEKTGKYKPTLFVKDSKEQISNKVSLEIMVTEELVSLSQIAFWSNRDVPEGDYNEDSQRKIFQ